MTGRTAGATAMTLALLTSVTSALDGAPRTSRPAGAVTLAITATGFRNARGHAIVALYAGADGWLKSERATRIATVAVQDTAVVVTFAELPAGTYAVSVIHDENDNGKLDMRYFPFPRPREGAGVSNDVRPRLGPPTWADARFSAVGGPHSVGITVRY